MTIDIDPLYTDINKSCYSNDGKTLKIVKDTSPYFRISAACEKIENSCFYFLNTLISFSFQENPNLTTIGNLGFYECKNLTTINLSSCSKLRVISSSAFYNCYNVSKILLPNGLLEIQRQSFSNNNLLTSITIPASVKIIEFAAFAMCKKLERVYFQEGSNLTELVWDTFSRTNITCFQIPEKVTKVNGNAFSRCILTNLTIHPNNNHFIVFNDALLSQNKSILILICNKSLKTFEIPEYITSIGEMSFSESNLVTITIPKTVKIIENCAFWNCDYLINVTFIEPVEFIGSQPFDYCDNLELISFPNSTMNIPERLFSTKNSPKLKLSFTCKILFSLESITRNTDISISYFEGQDLIIDSNLLISNSEQTEVYEYWGYHTSIYYGITIPKSYIKIRERAFQNSILGSIKFEKESRFSELGPYSFTNCTSIYSINFENTQLHSLGFLAFVNCTGLKYVRFPLTDFELSINAFKDCTQLEIVYNINNISENCFSGCFNLKNVYMRDGLTMIGARSFENCISLERISIPSSIRTISEYSFFNCTKLSQITFNKSNNLEYFSNNSFSGCDSLTDINDFSSDKYDCIDNTLYYKNDTGKYLIYHLSNSNDKILFVKCTAICSYSFNYSRNIENISISSNSVSLIEEYSFNNCDKLKYINFPLSIKTVEQLAFNACNSIQCALIIENKSSDYLKMINKSGISEQLIILCHVIPSSGNSEALIRFYSNPMKFFGNILLNNISHVNIRFYIYL